jgi:NAD(P)-dependent dehydrogenase (short-subunit alcohol dehydrogenase family)
MNHPIFQKELFSNKVIVVTGGGSGIGAEISKNLALLGAKVIIASRKKDRIDKAAVGLTKLTNSTVTGLVCNIRDRESVNLFVDKVITDFGKIDILINNGGGQFMSPAEIISDKGWDAVIQTNLTGTWNLSKKVASAWMLKNGGKIINITMLTHRGFPGMVHSVSARAGVEAMTQTLAVEWANRGIIVNAIQPGIIASSGMLNYPNGLHIANTVRSDIPLKRLGTCEEVSHMVTFLASPAGDYITGQIFTIDGGRSLWGKMWPIPDPKQMQAVEIPSWPWEG